MSDIADHTRQLADLFAKMAATVDDYRTEHFDGLPPAERASLEGIIQQLEDIHDRFTALAIGETLNAIKDDLDQITSVTTQAEGALKHLKTVREIVSVAAAAAELGADVVSGDYGAIPAGIRDVIGAVSGDSSSESEEASSGG